MKTPFLIIIYLGLLFSATIEILINDTKHLFIPVFTLLILGGFFCGKYGPEN